VASPSLSVASSPDFAPWLAAQQLSFAFTTYQTNRLFCVGTDASGQRLALHERLFDKPMGLFAQGERLHMSTRYQIWQLDNLLEAGETRQGCDRLYVPKLAHTTGDLNVHDVVIDGTGDLLFVNTDFSCLARLKEGYSFEPVWQPPFISKLVAEDRCHLNGLAMVDGNPAYMSACSATDTAAGWRDHRVAGGVLLAIDSGEIVVEGLSMPHSPRWYQGRLWVLNSGTGELGSIDLDRGQFQPLTFCPGFVRGLAFWRGTALVGLSKLRSRPFTGLALEDRLRQAGQTPQCGLMVIDLATGKVLHWLQLDGVVEELFDVVVLPGVARPQALGFQDEDIERLVTFPGSGGVVVSKPTVHRPSQGGVAPVAGVPRQVWEEATAGAEAPPDPASAAPPDPPNLDRLKFQRVYHLNAESLAPYDPFTFPSLQARWSRIPQTGELVGTSAAADGEMVGFAIAECQPSGAAEVISLYVAPAARRLGIGTRLMGHLERALREEGCGSMALTYQPTDITAMALEPLLGRLGWSPPTALPTGEKRATKGLQQGPAPTPIPVEARAQVQQGKAYLKQQQRAAAIACFQAALDQCPTYVAALNQLGHAHQRQGDLTAAAAAYQQILQIDPAVAQAHSNLGAIWQQQGDLTQAAAAYRQALALAPDLAPAHLNLAQLLHQQGLPTAAAPHYQAVLRTRPQSVEALHGLARVAIAQGQLERAEPYLRQVLALQRDHSAAQFDLARLHEALGQPDAALAAYAQMQDIPLASQPLMTLSVAYVRRQLADWQDYAQRWQDLEEAIETYLQDPLAAAPLTPLSLSVFPASPALHLRLNRAYAGHMQRRIEGLPAPPQPPTPAAPTDRLRVGYLSPDLRDHPVGVLLQGVFPFHQRCAAYAYGLHHRADGVQARIQHHCHQYVDCSELSPVAVAEQIRQDGIHVLVDLAGYTNHCRPEVLALRPAPVQVGFLGYPDTSGAPWMDGLIADEWVVPPALATHCSEEVAYMPHQFVADAALVVPPGGAMVEPVEELRQRYGLPAEGVVLCCFNAYRKLDPTAFGLWMAVLRRVPSAVLWLSDGPAAAMANLRATAQRHGVAPERIHFAPRESYDRYMARYRVADVFLDTFHYSAGSTAVCALAMGVPLLTAPGPTNASRMGASLCAAARLEALICPSEEAYLAQAVHLATHPDTLAHLRQRLIQQQGELPLFQPRQWMAAWEALCWQLWQQHGPSG